MKIPPSKRYLVDVNVWFAWLVNDNANHEKAKQWFSTLEPKEAVLCRIVQVSFDAGFKQIKGLDFMLL